MKDRKYPFPKEVEEVLEKEKRIENLFLVLNRYLPWSNFDEEYKGQFFKKIAKEWNEAKSIKGLLKEFHFRTENMMQSLEEKGYHFYSFEAQTKSRMVIGLGMTSVWETGMTLHPLYGIPYIPGSALKGLIRNFAIWEIAEKLSENPAELDGMALLPEEELKKNEKFNSLPAEIKEKFNKLRQIFGFQGQKSRVLFFDSYPKNKENLKLEVDVMTPHYGEYYQNKEAPADWLSPDAIHFLTIGKGAIFSFYLASEVKDEEGILVGKAGEWLKQAIEEQGVGAKTQAGYGGMEMVEPSLSFSL